jgi:glucose/arabinose dehydrogenase
MRRLAGIALLLLLAVTSAIVRAQASLSSRVYATGLSYPVAFVQDPTDARVQFVVQQGGRIRVVQDGNVLGGDFLDLTPAVQFGGEQGLLGLAFAPDYAATGRFYVHFSRRPDGNHVIARFQRAAGTPRVADAASRFDLRWGGPSGPSFLAQPFTNHNGGNLVFGPDGYLYLGFGDGGSAGDPANRAQNPATFLGKMLRVDVNVPDSDPQGYRVPADNPFVTGVPVPALPEIWAFGYRNPWRYSFDDPRRGGTGAMIVGDVGQDAWEEIDYEPAGRGGRNYGWRIREGAHGFDGSLPPAYPPLVDPVYEYGHDGSASVTGGFVYRGAALGAAFQGRYFFAEYVQGRVWSLALTVNPDTGEATASDLQEHTAALGGSATLGNISSFGVDAAGELYIVSYSRGMILKLAAPVPPRGVLLPG